MNAQTQTLEQSVMPMHQDVTKAEDNEAFAQKIKDRILRRLGKPSYFYKIDAHHLWENKWRVNVWIKTTCEEGIGVAPSHSICDSFFVTIKNNRISTNPKITKKYP